MKKDILDTFHAFVQRRYKLKGSHVIKAEDAMKLYNTFRSLIKSPPSKKEIIRKWKTLKEKEKIHGSMNQVVAKQ